MYLYSSPLLSIISNVKKFTFGLIIKFLPFYTRFMKKNIPIFLIFVLSLSVPAQNFEPVGGEYVHTPQQTVCLSDDERQQVIAMLQENQSLLAQQNKRLYSPEHRGGSVLFSWPVTKSAGLNYNSVWGISNYVDHDPNYPNQLSDYNCEPRTYDTASGYNHRGLDIYTWPFTWKIMDNDEAEIIAAAPGQIIAKADGNFDRSCSLSGGSWNAVYIEHADGTIAWYGHMKNGSVTSKLVGDFVSEGEYLGVVGSSGNSTGPHLHFEVWSDDTYTSLLDPYAGSCNNLNVNSLWQTQKPHENPNINAVLTHSDPPVFNPCPTTETTNESDLFSDSDTIYFGLYMRDQMDMTSANLKIIRPDDSVLYDWNFDFTANYYSSYWYWSFNGVFDMQGDWKWEATYNGQTVTHTFTVDNALSAGNHTLASTSVYPNPFSNQLFISSTSKIRHAVLYDITGKEILNISSEDTLSTIDTPLLANGLYFIKLQSEDDQVITLRMIKK